MRAQTVSQAFLTANFTQYGFGLVRGPEELTETLRREVIGTYERGGAREEHAIQAIEGPERSLFVDRPDLTRRVSSAPSRSVTLNERALIVFLQIFERSNKSCKHIQRHGQASH